MGFLDYIFLIIVGGIFSITAILLIFSIRSTKDPVAQKRYKRTYMPTITMSGALLVLYIGVLSIGNVALSIMEK